MGIVNQSINQPIICTAPLNESVITIQRISLTMFSALAAVCTVDCAIEIVLITLHYITLHTTIKYIKTMLTSDTVI